MATTPWPTSRRAASPWPRPMPAPDLARVEHRQRHGPAAQHGVVEGGIGEGGTLRGAGLVAQGLDAHLADLVGAGLAGGDEVAADLRADLALRLRRVGWRRTPGLLLAPALGVDAGVDHQADAAPDVAAQPAEVAVGVGVLAHLLGQPLRIEAPALDIGAVAAAGGAELRQAGQLLGDGDLHVMARQALVIGGALDLEGRGGAVSSRWT
jgi:hypothetical protein